jgi:hypothetical protein
VTDQFNSPSHTPGVLGRESGHIKLKRGSRSTTDGLTLSLSPLTERVSIFLKTNENLRMYSNDQVQQYITIETQDPVKEHNTT